MNASALRAFDQQSADAGLALWPATVVLPDRSEIAATIIRPREAPELGPFAEDPGTTVLTVRIQKAHLGTAPTLNTILRWESRPYKLRSLRGQEPTEAQWILHCTPSP